MPTTGRGYTYPASTGHTRLWEHLQTLATNINDDVVNLAAPPLAVLRQTTGQTIANNVFAAITLTTEDIDTANGHSTSSNTSRYTAQRAGYYQVSGRVSFVTSATAQRTGKLTKNGADIASSGNNIQAMSGGQTMCPVLPVIVQLAVGDYVELWGNQNSGGNLDTYVGVTYFQSAMVVRWVSD